jgi:hypothetical protein
MRTGLLSAAALILALSVPADSFAKQNGGVPSAGMSRAYTPRAPINPPRFQPVKAGPLKGPAMPPPGFRDRSIPTAALPQRLHRHSMRGRHGHGHHHAPRFGLGYLGSVIYPAYAYANYVYDDPQDTYAQDPQTSYKRLTPAGQCWTQSVQVSPDRSRDVRITRC